MRGCDWGCDALLTCVCFSLFFNVHRPGVLHAAAARLLDARDDFEEQRVCVEMSYNIVLLYLKCIEVCYFSVKVCEHAREM